MHEVSGGNIGDELQHAWGKGIATAAARAMASYALTAFASSRTVNS
jgi:RimJ/RimL family protein N-acetyltransferase